MNAERSADQPDEPLQEALDFLKRMPAPTRPPELDRALLDRFTAGSSPAVGLVSWTKRREFMFRLTNWSLAGGALIVAAGLVLMVLITPSVALGDVLKEAEKHRLVKYKMSQKNEVKSGENVAPLSQTVYADLKAPRSRMLVWMPGHLSGAIDFESVYIHDQAKGLTFHKITETITEKGKTDAAAIKLLKDFEKIGTPRKEVTLTGLQGDFTPATAEMNKSILENFRALEKNKDAKASKDKFQDKPCLLFRVEGDHKKTALWVDETTKLPLKLEHEITDPKIMHPTVTRMTFTLTDFEWDPELKEFNSIDDLFDTTAPQGYKVNDQRKKKEGASSEK